MTKWISVKDRLPEPGKYGKHVLVFGNDDIDIGFFYDDWNCENILHVSYWMPLPEKPDLSRHFEGCRAILRIEDGIGGMWECVDNCPQKEKYELDTTKTS